jgi:hypothetical protein
MRDRNGRSSGVGSRSSIPRPVGSTGIRRPLYSSYREHEKRAVFAGK